MLSYEKIYSLLGFLFCTVAISAPLTAEQLHPPPPYQQAPLLQTLYATLDPYSIAKHLTFYELYPCTKEGKLALERALSLLQETQEEFIKLPKLDLETLISLVNRKAQKEGTVLKEEQIRLIERWSHDLGNRKLKGHSVQTLDELLLLPPEDIDIARALFLADGTASKEQMLSYEASLDFMALQIRAKLLSSLKKGIYSFPSAEEKIRKINEFIFYEMRFRFPPHSLWADQIDLYTFLPSVIDNRKGVCLGVSILYLALAQRLDLPLQAITPPGHIYLRYEKKGADDQERVINIETTQRGVNPPSEVYLGIETRDLQKRNNKEVIGLAFMNQASVLWKTQDYKGASLLYEKARAFIKDDPLLTELLAYCYLFLDRKKEAIALLKESQKELPFHAVVKSTLAEDYLNHHTNEEGIQAVFQSVDETRNSILEKQRRLEKVVKKFPRFRAGLLQLASSHLQLSELKKAEEYLKQYYTLSPNDPLANYYLTLLAIEHYNFPEAWHHLNKLNTALTSLNHKPKALKDLLRVMKEASPSHE